MRGGGGDGAIDMHSGFYIEIRPTLAGFDLLHGDDATHAEAGLFELFRLVGTGGRVTQVTQRIYNRQASLWKTSKKISFTCLSMMTKTLNMPKSV